MSKPIPRFSKDSIVFLKKASRQKRTDWIERHASDYDCLIKQPFTHLALTVSAKLSGLAPDYHFPKRGLGRIKRTAQSIDPQKGYLYKNWISYNASKPRESRFEHNPSLFFLINSEDDEDPVLVAGGLYMPSSRQTRALREAIAQNASAFETLFASKEFKKSFPGGFSDEKISSRPARGYDPQHSHMHWLRLQAFFVWKSYSMREFSSSNFSNLVAQDFKQVLKLNRLIESAIKKTTTTAVVPLLAEIKPIRYQADF